jgi:hypothetical protein
MEVDCDSDVFNLDSPRACFEMFVRNIALYVVPRVVLPFVRLRMESRLEGKHYQHNSNLSCDARGKTISQPRFRAAQCLLIEFSRREGGKETQKMNSHKRHSSRRRRLCVYHMMKVRLPEMIYDC